MAGKTSQVDGTKVLQTVAIVLGIAGNLAVVVWNAASLNSAVNHLESGQAKQEMRADKLEVKVNDHETRISITEAQLRTP